MRSNASNACSYTGFRPIQDFIPVVVAQILRGQGDTLPKARTSGAPGCRPAREGAARPTSIDRQLAQARQPAALQGRDSAPTGAPARPTGRVGGEGSLAARVDARGCWRASVQASTK